MRLMLGLMVVGCGAVACTQSNAGDKASSDSTKVKFETSAGDIVIQFDAEKAPLSTQNVLKYVDKGFYDGTIFHRVIKNFMIQGGGFTSGMEKKPTEAAIKNEATNGRSNKRGTVAMARTSVIDSATSQFFINVVDNNRLDHRGTRPHEYGYAVVGEVVEGMEVVDKIVNTPTCPAAGPAQCTKPLPPGMRDVPVEAVVIKKASRI